MSLFRLTLNDPIIRHKLFIKTGDKSDRLVTWDHIPDFLSRILLSNGGFDPSIIIQIILWLTQYIARRLEAWGYYYKAHRPGLNSLAHAGGLRSISRTLLG